MQTNGRQGGSHTPPPRAQVCYHVVPRPQPPGPRHQPRREKTNGLRPGSGCHGGLTVLPCGAMRGNRDNCFYSTTTLFVAPIRTYTLMHSVVCRIPTYTRCHAPLCMHPPSLPFTGQKEKCVLENEPKFGGAPNSISPRRLGHRIRHSIRHPPGVQRTLPCPWLRKISMPPGVVTIPIGSTNAKMAKLSTLNLG